MNTFIINPAGPFVKTYGPFIDPSLEEPTRDMTLAFQSCALLPHNNITAVFVTHDKSKVMVFSNKIIVMEKGLMSQMGTPREKYYHPQNKLLADFIGDAHCI